MREERLTLDHVFRSFRVGHLVLLFLSHEVEHHRGNHMITFSCTPLGERKRGRGKEGGKEGGERKGGKERDIKSKRERERAQSIPLVTHFL